MLEEVANKINKCKKCGLWKTRKNPVPGEGNPNAEIILIAEAPGYNEDLQGKPFVGAAGKVLDELLASVELKKEEIFITNILKCRPPGNRNPKSDEIKACSSYLDKQIQAINPKVICTLGNFATKYILARFGLKLENIGKIHGQIFEVNTLEHHLKVIPMYHPAAAIYNPNMKETLIIDFLPLLKLHKSIKGK